MNGYPGGTKGELGGLTVERAKPPPPWPRLRATSWFEAGIIAGGDGPSAARDAC